MYRCCEYCGGSVIELEEDCAFMMSVFEPIFAHLECLEIFEGIGI